MRSVSLSAVLTSSVGGRHNMPPPPASWPFDLKSSVRVTCDVGYLFANFSLPRPLCSRLRPYVRNRQNFTEVRHQTDVERASSLNAPYPRGGGIIRPLRSTWPTRSRHTTWRKYSLTWARNVINSIVIKSALTVQLRAMADLEFRGGACPPRRVANSPSGLLHDN